MNHRIASTVLAIAFPTLALAGDTLVDNLGEPTRDRSEVSNNFPEHVDQFSGQAFTADAEYSLDLVQLILSGGVDGSVASFELRSGPEGPDALIATLIESSLPTGGDEIVTLTPTIPVTLVPGETYWVVASVGDPGFFLWAYADGNNWVGPGTIGNYVYSYDLGATWTNYGDANPFQMRVEVSSVPPPACYADCDGDLALTIDDFICFQTIFALGDPYADCDADGALTIDDFICFQTYFAIGC